MIQGLPMIRPIDWWGHWPQLGLRYKLNQHLALFGEWKYNRAHFSFDASTPNGNASGVKGDFSAHILAAKPLHRGLGRFVFLPLLSLLGFPPCVTFTGCHRPSELL